MGFPTEAGLAIRRRYLMLTASMAPPIVTDGAFRSFRFLRCSSF
jgi:hypothetical protein